MLVEKRLDERAFRHDLESFRLRIANQPLDERRCDAVAAQCLGNAGMFSDDRVDAEFSVGKLSRCIFARNPGLVAATQP